MFKFVTVLLLTIPLIAMTAPLSDARRLAIAKFLKPSADGEYGSWIELALKDYRLYIDAKSGQIERFSYRPTLTANDVISIKSIDQALIDHCKRTFKSLEALLK